MDNFTRTIKIIRRGFNHVRIEISYKDGRLSLVGDDCPNGRVSSCGQIVDSIRAEFGHLPAVALLCHYWHRWHLNDMQAGLPVQMDYLRAFPPAPKDCDWYTSACEALRAVNLYEVDGYKFGHKWIREEVPAHVLEWLRDAKIP